MSRKSITTPVRATMCETCPFRPGSMYADLAPMLTESALTGASRICHQTGRDNAINRTTGKPEHLCRGARDFQLKFFAQIRLLSEPTDGAWNDQRAKQGMTPIATRDPL